MQWKWSPDYTKKYYDLKCLPRPLYQLPLHDIYKNHTPTKVQSHLVTTQHGSQGSQNKRTNNGNSGMLHAPDLFPSCTTVLTLLSVTHVQDKHGETFAK